MKTRKAVLAASAVLLLTSLAVYPVFAENAPLYTKASDLSMSTSDVAALEHFYGSFLNDLSKVKNVNSFEKLVDSYLLKFGQHPLLRCLKRYLVPIENRPDHSPHAKRPHHCLRHQHGHLGQDDQPAESEL